MNFSELHLLLTERLSLLPEERKDGYGYYNGTITRGSNSTRVLRVARHGEHITEVKRSLSSRQALRAGGSGKPMLMGLPLNEATVLRAVAEEIEVLKGKG